ncbi:phosducin-like protein [Danaus plexippus]|uniref:Phosducin protein n=1 Tax=Danaus plexippus plexippus TaxID=278856 RepID=A0A212EK91_DANPL|nr:phosducin-like protein [Danaus plexippus]OWR41907.1 Phosducin protein [Danaus plexippus plexippus]
MATLEDKILGEKLHNYCSSSEDEGGSDDEDCQSSDEKENSLKRCQEPSEPPPVNNWSGSATNTGPKGVLEDWRRFKELEAQNREELAKERIALAKKLTMTVKTVQEEDKEKEIDELEDELDELIDEGFLMKYQQQRMQELMAQLQKAPKFGKLQTLKNQDDFLSAIDKEDVKVTVVIHIYGHNVKACESMDGCLSILASDYPAVKFCRIAVDVAGLSRHFSVEGVPALLVYKGGQIIGNFVQLATELGNDFFASNVEKFLIEYGMLPEN